MHSVTVRFSQRWLLVLLLLGVAGAVLNSGLAPVWQARRDREPALQLESTTGAAGQGTILAVLGGFRALVADALWLRMYVLWERQDFGGTDAMIHLVTAVDSRPVVFWLNGARMLAHDLSTWQVMAAGGYERVPESVVQAIDRRQAASALALLDAAVRVHPASPELWVERANIELNRLRDPLAAAASYRRAWELPRGPSYAARLHAEMLRRAGHEAEALAWLVQLHPQLPRDDEAAAADVVLGRIRDLERRLQVPADRVYRPHP
jgi:hypothetical protein